MSASYLVKRVGLLVLIIWLAVSINFVIPRLTPGDPVEQKLAEMLASSGGPSSDIGPMVAEYRARFGLDQPEWKQYLNYWDSILHLDLGYSLQNFPERVSDTILSALPWTIGLLGLSTLISFTLGTLLGSVLAWPRSPGVVKATIPVIMALSAIPYFLLGVVLVFFLAIVWKLFPPAGGFSFDASPDLSLKSISTLIYYGTLPSLSIVLTSLGAWALEMRGMMTTVLGEDYITLASASGLKQRTLFIWYAVRTSLLPQVTSLALTLGRIVSGAILVEVIFAYPGMGLKLYQAIHTKDYFVIQGIVLVLTVSIGVAMFALDLVYPLIDPRISYRRG